MREEVDSLLKALEESGCAGAEAGMAPLVAAIRQPIDDLQVRRALDALRSRRCFAVMNVLASRVTQVAGLDHSLYAGRQLAQARIELGLLDDAVALLETLNQQVMARGSSKELSEVRGLLGRAVKQRFVNAVAGGEKDEDDLRSAIGYYSQVFDSDPAWHGANVVALVARAERDGVHVDTDSSEVWARRLLGELQEKAEVSWGPWDYAAAGEAYLALEDDDNTADAFAHYWNMSNADPFALAGTERQLREIWQITADSVDPFRASLLAHLKARAIAGSGMSAHYTAAELATLSSQLQAASGQAEAVFGSGSEIPIDRVLHLLDKARCVCRITDRFNPTRGGTGFLVNGEDVSAHLQGELLVLTNHHVLHGAEASDALLESHDYRGSIDIGRAIAEFHYWNDSPEPRRIQLAKVVGFSPRAEADFTLASFEEDLEPRRSLLLSTEPKPLGSRNIVDPKQRAKVFVVGHPGGASLSFSVSDDEVVDHELDDTPPVPHHPRCIHYRTPTEPGSSGSPVFHHETLEVVGLHRSGHVKPLRPDWPRPRKDEPYEANEAVAIRSIRDYLA
jgi:Trypsin-like peptidase domain/Tetratricopeptide Repeats-Sensor